MTIKKLRNLLSNVAAATAVTVSGAAGAIAEPGAGDAGEADAPEPGGAAGLPLATALRDLPPLEATAAACELALSTDHLSRLAIASALEWRFRLVGDDIVIDHLASDANARVRRAAARAAWARRAAGGDPGVLARLVDDPDPDVREVAALAEPHR